jgi:hypothetical protein
MTSPPGGQESASVARFEAFGDALGRASNDWELVQARRTIIAAPHRAQHTAHPLLWY